jgi:hypothetical protein
MEGSAEKNSELFLLIKSLSKNEKTYFKKFSKQHIIGNKNNYEILFDTIDKMENFDEDLFIKKLSKHSFIRYLPRLKTYLYEFILKALVAYHNEHSLSGQVSELIREVEILCSKKLYKSADRLINKALKICRTHDFISLEYQILIMKIRLDFERFSFKNDDDLNNNFDRIDQLLIQLQELNCIDKLGMGIVRTMHLSGKNFGEDNHILKSVINMYNSQINSTKFQLNDNSHNFNIQSLMLLSIFHEAYSNESEAINFSILLLKYFEDNAHLILSNSRRYMIALHNHILHLMEKSKYDEALIYCYKLKGLPEYLDQYCSEEIRELSYVDSFVFLLKVYIELDQEMDGLNLIEEFNVSESGLQENFYNLSRRTAVNYSKLLFYFQIKEFRKAKEFANNILNNSLLSNHASYHFTEIINIIIHYELGNIDYVMNVLISLKSKFIRLNKFTQFEKVFFDLFASLIIANNPSDKSKLFQVAASNIIQIIDNINERNKFFQFNLQKWVIGKL